MKKVNRYIYEIIYALNKLTSKWLKDVNNRIKEKGLDAVISNNEDNNIYIQEKTAQAKYSAEDKEKIEAYKSTFTPINEGETVQCIQIEHLGKGTNEKVQKILTTLEDNQDNAVIARVASIMRNTVA